MKDEETKAKNSADLVELIDYREAASRLDKIINRLKEAFDRPNCQWPDAYTLTLLRLSFEAQKKVILALNDEHLNSLIPWDKKTDLPSAAAFLADLKKFCQWEEKGLVGDKEDQRKALLESWLDWSKFFRETIYCCCGRSRRWRGIEVEVMVRTFLRVRENEWVLNPLIAVRSQDRNHLRYHYIDLKNESCGSGGAVLFSTEHILSFGGSEMKWQTVLGRNSRFLNFDKIVQRVSYFAESLR